MPRKRARVVPLVDRRAGLGATSRRAAVVVVAMSWLLALTVTGCDRPHDAPTDGLDAPAPDASDARAQTSDAADDVAVQDDAPPGVPDPTGFHAVASLRVPRAQATATRLADGRVLVVGGDDARYAMLASVEVFDPVTNTVRDAAPLPAPRAYHSATLLRSGQVLVVGGGQGSAISLPTGEGTLASALLYDPVADAWRATSDMRGPRAGHRAVLLGDGRVLVVGGGDRVGYPCASGHANCTVAASVGTAEIFDPRTETWSDAPPLAQPRLAFSLDATPAGVVAAGGAANNRGLTSVEIFDGSSWRAGPPLVGQRLYHAAVVLDARLVVAGGKIANVAPVTSVDRLAADGSSWEPGAALDQPRTGAVFVALPSGRGLLVGGNNQLGTRFLDEAAVYDVAADRWTPIGSLENGRYGHAAVPLDDGSVLVVGGRAASGVLGAVERSR